MSKIITSNVYPPIPCRDFDWSAITDNYEPGCPIGHGATEQEAVIDLSRQMDEPIVCPVCGVEIGVADTLPCDLDQGVKCGVLS